MGVLDSRTYKRIEWRLYHYHELRRGVLEAPADRADVLHRGRTPASPGGGGVSHRSDPTATKALEMVEIGRRRKEAAPWVQVIEHTIRRYEESDKGQLLELKYFSDMSEDYICSVLNIERTTYYGWKNELVIFTAMVAIQYGLLWVV